MSEAERETVERARAGDAEAFGRLAERYAGPLAALARARLDRAEDARDAVQDAFVAAWERIDTLRDADAFGPWLSGILRRVCAARIRRDRLWRAIRRAWRTERGPEAGASPLSAALGREEAERLRAGVEALPEALREAVLVRHLGGAGRAEAAAVLGISPETLDRRLHRARAALRERLAEGK